MQNNVKTAKHFSMTLMKQNIKSSFIFMIVITLIMCLMSIVISYAMSKIEALDMTEKQAAQTTFSTHLSAVAIYNEQHGTELSADGFMEAEDKSAYQAAFDAMNEAKPELGLSVENFSDSIKFLTKDGGSIKPYVSQVEYALALEESKGAFTDEKLSIDGLFASMLATMDIDPQMIQTMQEMDPSSMMDKMYYTIMGILPLLLFVVIIANSLVVNQVDGGSMAYVLATPTKRSAVANTQTIFQIVAPLLICAVTCIVQIAATAIFGASLHVGQTIVRFLGMYLLVEAFSGICFMGSCLFNRSRYSTAFGGGIVIWCFIASLLGMYGSKDMTSMGMGVEALDVFNYMTLTGLFDIQSIGTIGTGAFDPAFIWKFVILAVVAVATFLVGKFAFQRKDLPL